jgi:hypothetical protein
MRRMGDGDQADDAPGLSGLLTRRP